VVDVPRSNRGLVDFVSRLQEIELRGRATYSYDTRDRDPRTVTIQRLTGFELWIPDYKLIHDEPELKAKGFKRDW